MKIEFFYEKGEIGIFLWSQRNFSEIEGHSEKGGNASLPQRELISNYRTISVLPYFSKIFENYLLI